MYSRRSISSGTAACREGACRFAAATYPSVVPRLALLMGIFTAHAALAAPVTADVGGQIRQGVEKELPAFKAPSSDAGVAAPLAPTAQTSQSSVKFVLNRVDVSGNTYLSSAELAQRIKHWIGKEVDFSSLQDIAQDISKAYKDVGRLVDVVLPPQTIESGVVRIDVHESRLGQVRVEGENAADPALQAFARATILVLNPQGQAISSRQLDTSLLLLSDLPGIQSSARLQRGSQANETDVVLNIARQPELNALTSLDNAGQKSTGQWQFNGSLQWTSPFAFGDEMRANLVQSEGLSYGRFGYTRLIGDHGWRWGVEGSVLNYQIKATNVAALDIRGASYKLGSEMYIPLVRQTTRNIWLSAALSETRYRNSEQGVLSSQYLVQSGSADLQTHWTAQQDGTALASTQLGLRLTFGHVNLANSPNEAADARTANTAGEYGKLNIRARRDWYFSTGALRLSGEFQNASKNLDGSEKLYLGGINSIRAYPSSVAGGSNGQTLSAEWFFQPIGRWRTSAFYDWGQVYAYRHSRFPGAPEVNRVSLDGLGLSATWSPSPLPTAPTVKLVWACIVSGDRALAESQLTPDARRPRQRLWVQSTIKF